MTHYDILKDIVETNPWEIAHRLWDCMDCPKLVECNKQSHNLPTTKAICENCINEWLQEEIKNS